MPEKVLGTHEQHAELDADYKQILDGIPKWNYWSQMFFLELWRDEKVYLSKHGQRYPKLKFGRKKAKR
jgi:hypothetical protein